MSVVLLATVRTERPVLAALPRQLVSPQLIVVLGALAAALRLIEQPLPWLACAVLGAVLASILAFPEMAAALPAGARRLIPVAAR